jgi:hypothetical protein
MRLQQAMEAARAGNVVARKAWAGSGLFMYSGISQSLCSEEVVPNMTSLPPAVKAIFADRYCGDAQIKGVDPIDYNEIKFTEQYWLVNARNEIRSFIPGKKETIANDWVVVAEAVMPTENECVPPPEKVGELQTEPARDEEQYANTNSDEVL